MQYAAFLRGINVGGNSMIKMADLKVLFEKLGFMHVKTILNSGNVVFDTEKKDIVLIEQSITAALKKLMHRDVSVMVRTGKEIQELVGKNPFETIFVTAETRLYVTLLPREKDPKAKHEVTIPYISPENDFQILSGNDKEVCSCLIVSPNRGTLDLMSVIEGEFGRNVTTRNWNTIEKVEAALR